MDRVALSMWHAYQKGCTHRQIQKGCASTAALPFGYAECKVLAWESSLAPCFFRALGPRQWILTLPLIPSFPLALNSMGRMKKGEGAYPYCSPPWALEPWKSRGFCQRAPWSAGELTAYVELSYWVCSDWAVNSDLTASLWYSWSGGASPPLPHTWICY